MNALRWVAATLSGLLLSVVPVVASAAPNFAQVRVVNACACGVGWVGLALNGAPLASGLAYGAVTPFAEVGSGQQTIGMSGLIGTEEPMVSLAPGGDYTLVTTGEMGAPLLTVRENVAAPDPGAFLLRVVLTTPSLQAAEIGLNGGPLLDARLRVGTTSPAFAVAPGSHLLDLYSPGGWLMGSVPISGGAGQELTVVVTGTPGGVPALTAIAISTPQWVLAE